MRRPRNHAAAPMATNASASRSGGSSNTTQTIAAARDGRYPLTPLLLSNAARASFSLFPNRMICAAVDPLAQILAGLEVGNVFTGQGDRLAGLGIASLPRGPEMQRKAAEPADLDALPLGER